jgi:G-patch domain
MNKSPPNRDNKVFGSDSDEDVEKKPSLKRKKDVDEEIVIPLIKKNVYGLIVADKRQKNSVKQNIPIARSESPVNTTKESVTKTSSAPVSLDQEALDAVISAALNREDTKFEDLPIIAQNAIPGMNDLHDEDSKFRHDVSMRPDDITNYSRVPIEHFGMAMLKGMGWKEGAPVGKNPNGIVNLVQLTPRPKLQGLGAEPDPVLDAKPKKVRPGDKIPAAVHFSNSACRYTHGTRIPAAKRGEGVKGSRNRGPGKRYLSRCIC